MTEIPEWIRAARAKWKYRGQTRPSFAIEPAANQESAWDYPRPPRVIVDPREVVIQVSGTTLARTRDAIRVMETASPPTFYLPSEDVDMSLLPPAAGGSFCEWKGQASYYSVAMEDNLIRHAAWSYQDPLAGFEPIAGYLAFYPGKLECFVGGERVAPQPGGLYGGWITSEVAGPFKGEPGTENW